MNERLIPDEAAMVSLAAAIAKQCREGDCILLQGDLGAGKTTFARGFIQTLVPQAEEIVSPTFTLVQTYLTPARVTIHHFDLYRLEHEEELREIGLDEALQSGITLIEWPDLARKHLPSDALEISIRIEAGGEARQVRLTGWTDRLRSIA